MTDYQKKTELDYPPSWYAHTLTDKTVRPKLAGSLSADVIVIGGGLAGLTTALECLRGGKSVVVLEAKHVGWGASGRNGGFVMAGFAQELASLVKKVGIETARKLYGYSRMGVDYVRKQALVMNPSLIMGDGAVAVSRYKDTDNFALEAKFLEDECEHVMKQWDTKQTRNHLASDRYFDGLYDADGFHIHPLNYVRHLADEIEALGGLIYENSKASGLDLSQKSKKVFVDEFSVSGTDVVLCTSAYGRRLIPRVARSVLPVATHVVVTEPLKKASNPIRTRAAVADTRRAGDYYRMIDEDRLLWGGKITTRQTPPSQLQQKMKDTMSSTYPELRNTNVDFGWSGLMGYAVHKMPIIDEIQPGVWVGTAFGGHGLNTTAMAGCLLASAITQGDTRWQSFSHFGTQWAGGLVGKAGVQTSYWMMQLKDKIDESMSNKDG